MPSTRRSRTRASTSPSRSTGRLSGAIRTCWIPEAARILRPGGRLVFETLTPLVMMCFPTHDDTLPAEPTLHRDFFGMHRFEWHDDDGDIDAIEFHLGHGEMIRLLRTCGLEVEDLMELQAPSHGMPGTTTSRTSGHGDGRAPRSGSRASGALAGQASPHAFTEVKLGDRRTRYASAAARAAMSSSSL